MRKRVLLVGRTRYELPLSPSLARKFDALSTELDVRVMAAAAPAGRRDSDPRFRLYPAVRPRRLDGPLYYALFPLRVARELRAHRPDVVLAQGGPETALALVGRALARVPARVVMDVHGDLRAPTRLYGSRLRQALAPLGDTLTRIALRRADAVRTLSPFTSSMVRESGVEPAAAFPAFMDLDAFLDPPPAALPERPAVLFVGVLERYKAVDVLAEAWRLAAPRIPDAELRLVGRGTMTSVVERLVAEGRARWTPTLAMPEVTRALDEATALVLPSRSEGLPRIAVEAFCRGRGVVGTRAGGIPDLVVDGETGLLVPPEDPQALADALVRVVSDRELAERLGAGAHRAAHRWAATPEEYARRVRELVEQVVSE